jgi:GT2 family glycosyltransferase
MVSLTAVVPATNDPPTLAACLEAIAAAEEPPEQVVIVTEGDGPASARNSGAADAVGDVVVFVDADVLPHTNAFRRIRAVFDADPDVTAVFGSYDDTPADSGVVSQFRNLLHHHVHQHGAGEATAFWAGLGAVRTAAFRDEGGFDAERYKLPSVEDIDLGTRLVAAGGRIMLDPLLQGTHLKRWTLSDMVRTDFSLRGVPWVELVLRHRAGASTLNLGWRHRVSAVAAVISALAVLRGRPGTALCGFVALTALNAEFYGLLLRRQGPTAAAAGVGLHAVHHVTGALAVPVGIARHLNGDFSARPLRRRAHEDTARAHRRRRAGKQRAA